MNIIRKLSQPMARRFLLFITLGIISVAALAGTRPGDFKIVGPGGGGAMFTPIVSPHDPKEMLVSCDMSGAYITHDGGQSWRMFSLRGVVRFFAFDPLQPKTMYAGTRALWRSTDNGETWNMVWPKPATIRDIEMNGDHAEEWIFADNDPLGVIVALAIDPQDSKTLVAVAAQAASRARAGALAQPALFISRNSGDSWEKLTNLPEVPRRVWIDPRSKKDMRDLYVAGDNGVMVRHDGKWENRKAPAGVVFTDISMGFSKQQGAIVYATSKDGIHVSRDGGTSWSSSILPGTGAQIRAIATSLNHPEVAYVSYRELQLSGKSWMGVAKTNDAGRTWSLVWKEDPKVAAHNVHDAWLTQEFFPDWGENPFVLTVADQDPNVSWGTDYGRMMGTTDGGKNWYSAYSKRVPGAKWTTTGLDVTSTYSLIFDPFDGKRRFSPYTDIGLIRSDDGGRSWTRSAEGIPEKWLNTTYWVLFDPQVKGRAWAVTSSVHDLPRPKMWRHTPASTFKGGVVSSTDGGVTWKASSEGMPETATTHIVLDPTSPVDRRVLWVAAMGTGVFKSSDGGATWAPKNNGITQKEPLAWRLARAGDGTLYVIIARRSEDGSIGTSGDGALYKSTDGAETWTPVTLPAGVNGPNGLQIDPTDPKRLYLAAWARATGMRGDGGGVFLSTDGGSTWTTMLDRDRHVYDVTIDSRDPKVLYAAGFESSVWRSADQGAHWTRVGGFNFKWAHRVIPDPDDPTKIFVATFGGGLWHGSINGEDRPIDIATPEMLPGREFSSGSAAK